MPLWAQIVLGLLGIAATGGGALLLVRAQRRKLYAEAAKIAAETEGLRTRELREERAALRSAERELAEELDRCRQRTAGCEKRERELEKQADEHFAEARRLVAAEAESARLIDALRIRVATLEKELPWATTLDGLRRLQAAWRAWDEAPLPLVVTSDRCAEGRAEPAFLRVNRAFCAALGMTAAEIIEAGPWRLIEAADTRNTVQVERDARAGSDVSTVNWFRGRGVRVQFRWGSTPYLYPLSAEEHVARENEGESTKPRKGFAFAWAEVVRREEV